jgi:anthranilate synthase component 1
MHFLPSLQQAEDIAREGAYDILPVSTEILSDICTPIEAMRILKSVSTHCYMLESAVANEKWGRYTFLGFDPKLEITCVNGLMKVGQESFATDNPSEDIRRVLSGYRSFKRDDLPPFTGGLVGYFSYDYFSYREPSARCPAKDTEAFKDVDLMLFDKVIAFDNVRQKIVLIANMRLDDPRGNYERAVAELKALAELLRGGAKTAQTQGRITGPVELLFDREAYCGMVRKAKDYIREGEIFQIVLSNRLSAPFSGSLLDTYRVLRTINPSPYMFYFSGTDVEVAGASPETLVKLEN